jgi:hypothetical protein
VQTCWYFYLIASSQFYRTLITKNSVVAVYGDDPEYQFYIMKVTNEPHVVNRNVSDDWGFTFTRGSEFLKSF